MINMLFLLQGLFKIRIFKTVWGGDKYYKYY